MSVKSRLSEAFQENFNLVGLAGAAAVSLATLNPIPLLVGAVAEAAYLLFVPDSRWYTTRLDRRFDAAVLRRRERLKEEIFPLIGGVMEQRFLRLENLRTQIGGQQPGAENARWFREVARKLDYLLEKFLLFARKDAEFRGYLRSVHEELFGATAIRRPVRDKRRNRPADFDLSEDEETVPPSGDRWVNTTVAAVQERYLEEIGTVTRQMEVEEDLNTKAILEKRADVLQQRHDHLGRIGKIVTNLHHQMQLLEDSFGLINDQLRARSPEQVLADIEGVVYQTDAMTKLLDELAPLEEMAARVAA